MYFCHSLAGALTVKPIIDRIGSKFTEKENVVLWFIGITSSVLPDFDILYYLIKSTGDHRSFVTHGIFLYFLMFISMYVLSFYQKKEVFGRKFFKALSYVFIVGVITHFLIDFVVGGVVLLAPFSYQVYGLTMNIRQLNPNWLLAYLESNYMFFEFFILFLFLVNLRGRHYVTARVFALSYLLVALSAFVFISSLLF